ncbi:hypothetical protein FKV68_21835 (plasmid) [Sinorhizobium mexicanum]|uniref:Uncharacterized protein n=1 Tax=Sinorhizobium mexicanum TaxID=375549 RepID=A0A859QUD4_9HYPH|nr:hypothetical protein [Sinorhizobium mexicanum]QLL64096.1 hypothetical protein FKV68_21835 [Sinorhizobium mexicanum]
MIYAARFIAKLRSCRKERTVPDCRRRDPDAFLKLPGAHNAKFQTENARKGTDIVLDSGGLLLKQVARAQRGAPLLTCQRFDMDRSKKFDAHHLRCAGRVVSIGRVNLCLRERLWVPCLDAERRQPGFSEATEQPSRQRSSL